MSTQEENIINFKSTFKKEEVPTFSDGFYNWTMFLMNFYSRVRNILKIDFGTKVGLKSTSAQITNYSLEELIGRQVVAVCNLPSKKVAGFTSEVLILGAVCGENVHLLRPDIELKNGTLIG